MVEIKIWPTYLKLGLRVFIVEVSMSVSWYGEKMGSAYLLLTIGSVMQFWFPNMVWALIPLAALIFGFSLEKN